MAEKLMWVNSDEFKREIKRALLFLERMGKSAAKSAPDVQNRMANIVADAYVFFLRLGVEPENTKLTMAIHGMQPPLSSLADHVVVRESSSDKPAIVTFEPGWGKIAVIHNLGYAMQVTEQQRKALFAMATANGYKVEDFINEGWGNNSGIWTVPARPHLHMLSADASKHTIALLLKHWLDSGKSKGSFGLKRTMMPRTGERERFTPIREVSSDEIQLADRSGDDD
jgi:hypothetical protein